MLLFISASLPHNQTRAVHTGDHIADVQDPSIERADSRVQPVRAIPRRDQV